MPLPGIEKAQPTENLIPCELRHINYLDPITLSSCNRHFLYRSGSYHPAQRTVEHIP